MKRTSSLLNGRIEGDPDLVHAQDCSRDSSKGELHELMNDKDGGWMQRLAQRWGVAPSRVVLILVVFACTGLTVMFLKRPVVEWVAGTEGEQPLLFSVLYYLLILPIYNILLLIYGVIFGQFRFFWDFEKRFFNRLFRRRTE